MVSYVGVDVELVVVVTSMKRAVSPANVTVMPGTWKVNTHGSGGRYDKGPIIIFTSGAPTYMHGSGG
jgi:hypothetical protein